MKLHHKFNHEDSKNSMTVCLVDKLLLEFWSMNARVVLLTNFQSVYNPFTQG